MAGGVRRVTVVGSVRRLDLAVPAAAPVAEPLPDVVALAEGPGSAATLPRWSLSGFGTGDLPPSSSLESAGVPDGTVLYLRRIDEPVVGLQGADVVERAASQVTSGATVDRTVLGGAAAALLVLVAGLLLADGRPAAGLGAAAAAVLALVTGAWTATRPEGVPGAAASVALTAGPLLAVAAVLGTASAVASPSGPLRLAAGLAGLAAGAALAALVVRAARVAGTCAAALALTAAERDNFVGPVTRTDVRTEPLWYGNAHDAATPLGRGRSLFWGASPRDLLQVGSTQEYQRLWALPDAWGARNSLTVVQLPEGHVGPVWAGQVAPQPSYGPTWVGGAQQQLHHSLVSDHAVWTGPFPWEQVRDPSGALTDAARAGAVAGALRVPDLVAQQEQQP